MILAEILIESLHLCSTLNKKMLCLEINSVLISCIKQKADLNFEKMRQILSYTNLCHTLLDAIKSSIIDAISENIVKDIFDDLAEFCGELIF